MYKVTITPASYLQPAIQRPLDGDAFAGVDAVGGDGGDERVQLVLLLLQLFHQTLDGTLGEALVLSALSVTHQAVDDAETGVSAAGGGAEHRHGHLSGRGCVTFTVINERELVLTLLHNFYPILDRWTQTDGHRQMWKQTDVDTHRWTHTDVKTDRCGHRQMWTQTQMDTDTDVDTHTDVKTDRCGHTQMWTHTDVDTHRCGHTHRCGNRQMWTHTQVDTDRCGHTHRCENRQMWTQTDVDTHRWTQTQMWKQTDVDTHTGGHRQMWTHTQM